MRGTLAALSIAIGFLAAYGQVLTGTISETVTDPSTAVVPGASVTIVNSDTCVTAWRDIRNVW